MCHLHPLFSALSRSKEKVELESSSPASSEKEEKTSQDYSEELEALCEQLQATLDGLVRPNSQCRSSTSLSLKPSGTIWGLLDNGGIQNCQRPFLSLAFFHLPNKS